MKRSATQNLIGWKNNTKRKPLIVFGARQVGKTWLMKNFGQKYFKHFVYVNFEKEVAMREIFKLDYNPSRIVKLLEVISSDPIIPGETIVILDEIQEAQGGLTSLKYFYEEMPNLHIICAGSLLGISTSQKSSFPVGKVQFLNLYPLSFSEFLLAKGKTKLINLIDEEKIEMIETFRDELIFLLKQYYCVGGMPEAVNSFIENENFHEIRDIHRDILQAYDQDFSKHAPTGIIPKIRMIWHSVVSQLSKENKKFLYGLIKTGARAKEFETAISWLEDYGLIYKVYKINNSKLPISSYRDVKSFKLFVSDVGLLATMAGLDYRTIIEKELLFQEFKGSLTEQFVFQQINSERGTYIHYWANESGSAEVDFVFESSNQIIPLEVKASENLQSKSLRVFADKYPNIHCYRTSLSPFRKEKWLTNIPLYMITILKNKHQ